MRNAIGRVLPENRRRKSKSQSTLQGVSTGVITEMHEYRIGRAKMLSVLERLNSNP